MMGKTADGVFNRCGDIKKMNEFGRGVWFYMLSEIITQMYVVP